MQSDQSPAPPKRLPGWVSLLLRVTATVIAAAVVLRGIEWPRLWALLEHCDWRWWLAGFAMSVSTNVIAGIRWAYLARPIGFALPLGTFVWRFFEGQFFSLCLPSSIGGDVFKAYRLARTTQGRLLAACTVLADRLTGLAALGVLAGTAIAAREFSLATGASLCVGFVLLGAALLAFWLGLSSLDRLLQILPEGNAARQFLARLLPYQRQPSLIARAVGWSLFVQVGGALVVALVARGLGVSLPMSVWFAVVPPVALAMVLPISINGVGIREGGLAFLLKPSGVSTDEAVAIGLLWFLCGIVGGMIGGLLFLLDRDPIGASPPAAVPHS